MTDLRKRGRPKQFDPTQVVANAMTAFWAKGYENTTLEDLEEATGVDRSTIYNSFGGKTGLYESAAGAYVDRGDSHLFAPLSDGDEGLADIVEFLNRVQAIHLSDDTPPGCLIINDLACPPNAPIASRYLESVRTGIEQAIDRSNRVDGTDPAHNSSRQVSLVAAVIGTNLTHRRDPDRGATNRTFDGLRQLVGSWSTRT
jgi:AcrR family transcriptional regulator